jgi:hypothetical protein
VLRVYTIAKTRTPDLASTEIDKLVALQAKGELKAHLDTLAASRTTP